MSQRIVSAVALSLVAVVAVAGEDTMFLPATSMLLLAELLALQRRGRAELPVQVALLRQQGLQATLAHRASVAVVVEGEVQRSPLLLAAVRVALAVRAAAVVEAEERE